MKDVAAAWAAGESLKSGNVRTDGSSIWSWRLRIGFTRKGEKVAYDYRGGVSVSTSRHVGVVIEVADRVSVPPRKSRQ